jgi:hypothetical protein
MAQCDRCKLPAAWVVDDYAKGPPDFACDNHLLELITEGSGQYHVTVIEDKED